MMYDNYKISETKDIKQITNYRANNSLIMTEFKVYLT